MHGHNIHLISGTYIHVHVHVHVHNVVHSHTWLNHPWDAWKERQGNTTQLTQGGYFQRKKLPQVGFESTTIRLLGVALTNWATEAAQLAGLESHIQYQATKALQPKHHKPETHTCTCTYVACSHVYTYLHEHIRQFNMKTQGVQSKHVRFVHVSM